MDEQRLWAPWRLGYIKGEPDAEELRPRAWREGADQQCFLCRAAAEYDDPDAADRALLVLHRGEHTICVLNRYPYSNCHVLVSPLRHTGTLESLTDQEHLEAMRLISRLTERLSDLIGAQGFNIGLNQGSIAGAGVPGHLHWHVVPRWPGDHNFMPTLAGVRVIPQSLEAAWELLRDTLR